MILERVSRDGRGREGRKRAGRGELGPALRVRLKKKEGDVRTNK